MQHCNKREVTVDSFASFYWLEEDKNGSCVFKNSPQNLVRDLLHPIKKGEGGGVCFLANKEPHR